MYSRYTQMHQESLSNQSNLLTITEAFMVEKTLFSIKICVFFLPLSHSKEQNTMNTENASGPWQASLTMCSLRRFHVEPRKTAGVAVFKSQQKGP